MLNKKMMGSAQKVIVLADSSKFNRKGFGKICMLSEVDLIITDSGLNKNIQQDILDAGVELHIAQ
jgi:DeoR family transcriptional regulator of aga operon